MSREIKFRGQTRRKGERIINMAGDKCEANWVYGGIFPQNNGGDLYCEIQSVEVIGNVYENADLLKEVE